MKDAFHRMAFLSLILGMLITGCSTNHPVESATPQGEVSTLTLSPSRTQTPLIPSSTSTATLSPVPSATLTATIEITEASSPQPDTSTFCEGNWCVYPGHFWLSNPIEQAPIDHTYRYGGTQQYFRETHHGIEFIDASGTPVVAAADGIVIVAGSDRETIYGLYKGFYGNVVILEHQSPFNDQKIYTLYGHLSSIDVHPGDLVLRGQYLGDVGSTGSALGSHLHFEVRLGTNSYQETCNPELWLIPQVDPLTGIQNGAVAVRMLDGETPIYTYPVTIEYYPDPAVPVISAVYTESYAWNTPNSGIWQENLAVNNLPPGQYRVSFIREDRSFKEVIMIYPGQLTIVNFNAE